MFVRCGLVIARREDIGKNIRNNKAGIVAFYSVSQTRHCTTGAVPQHEGAVLGRTTQLFLDKELISC